MKVGRKAYQELQILLLDPSTSPGFSCSSTKFGKEKYHLIGVGTGGLQEQKWERPKEKLAFSTPHPLCSFLFLFLLEACCWTGT